MTRFFATIRQLEEINKASGRVEEQIGSFSGTDGVVAAEGGRSRFAADCHGQRLGRDGAAVALVGGGVATRLIGD